MIAVVNEKRTLLPEIGRDIDGCLERLNGFQKRTTPCEQACREGYLRVDATEKFAVRLSPRQSGGILLVQPARSI